MYSYSDVAAFAQTKQLGDYNNVIDLFSKELRIGVSDMPTFYIHENVGHAYGWSAELTLIVNEFVKEFGPQEILMS